MKLGHILIFVIPLWRNPSSSYKGISPLPKMKFLDPELQIIFIPILVSFGRQDILHLVELNLVFAQSPCLLPFAHHLLL